MAQSKSWSAKLRRDAFLIVLICAAVTEGTSALGLKLLGFPVYWTDEALNRPKEIPLRSDKDPWGRWGIPSTTSHLVSTCYNVEYKFNSVGARDREREIQSPKRWIVLGDSGPEGWGIEENDRFTDILEQKLGWEFANFSNEGFGPLNYLLVYKLLAKKFEHYGVIVGFSLYNDFSDGDVVSARESNDRDNTYWPWWILAADGRSYRIIYGVNGDAKPRLSANVAPPEDEQKSTQDQSSTIRVIGRDLSRVSATFSLLRQLSAQRTERGLFKMPRNWGGFTDNPRQITAATLIMHDLAQEIGNRPKILIMLPLHANLVEVRKRGTNYSKEVEQFLDGLRADGWTIIDPTDFLLPLDQSEDITVSCPWEIHWNAKTNAQIADFLIQHYRGVLTGEAAPIGRQSSQR